MNSVAPPPNRRTLAEKSWKAPRRRSGAAAERRGGGAARRRSGAAAERRGGGAARRRSGAAAERRGGGTRRRSVATESATTEVKHWHAADSTYERGRPWRGLASPEVPRASSSASRSLAMPA